MQNNESKKTPSVWLDKFHLHTLLDDYMSGYTTLILQLERTLHRDLGYN